MKNSIKFLICSLFLFAFGCASLPVTGLPHTASLIVGDSGEKVLSDVVHVLGSPKSGGKSPVGDKKDEIEIRVFDYSDEYDLGLYFHKGIFMQAVVYKIEDNKFPQIRKDYKDIQNRVEGPDGYLLSRKGKKVSLEVITKKR